jgi:hypothetical protein
MIKYLYSYALEKGEIKYNKMVHGLFIHTNEAYNSIAREEPCNYPIDFEAPMIEFKLTVRDKMKHRVNFMYVNICVLCSYS